MPRNEKTKIQEHTLSFYTFLSNFPLKLPKEIVSHLSLTIAYLSKSLIPCPHGAFYKSPPSTQFHSHSNSNHTTPSSFSSGPPSDLHSLHMLFPYCFHFFYSFDHFLLWGWKKEVMFFVFILGCRKHKKSY